MATQSGVATSNMSSFQKKTFMPGDLFLSPDAPKAKYEEGRQNKTVAHWGQLKLAINDIIFLNYFWKPQDYPEIKEWVFVVAGAAPGHHFPVIAEMFPMFRFVLYDPSPFSINKDLMSIYGPRIELRNEFFTDEVAQQWSHKNNVFFSSDIRRSFTRKMRFSEIEKIVAEDMMMQKRWVEIMNPHQAMLKYRLPYVNPGPDGSLTDISFKYFDGFVVLQPWAAAGSSETRLVPAKRDGKYLEKDWSSIEYQDQLFYHNTTIREAARYNNESSNPSFRNNADRWDEVATLEVLKSYIQKMTGNPANFTQSEALLEHIIKEINKSRREATSIEQQRIKTSRKK